MLTVDEEGGLIFLGSCVVPLSSSSIVRSMTPLESLLEAFPLCDVLSAAFLLIEVSTVLFVWLSVTILGVAELFCSAEDGGLKVDIGIFICIGPRLLEEL